MPLAHVIHWKAAEADPLLAACRAAGLDVDFAEGGGPAVANAIRARTPQLIVIDLSRLPSHGRAVANWLHDRKSTRAIPIVFVGGDPGKVGVVSNQFPDALYCDIPTLPSALRKALSARPAGRVAPAPRKIGKEAVEKLGISPKTDVAVIDAPRDFPALLGTLPDGVNFVEEQAPLTLWFVHEIDGLLTSLRDMRKAAARTRLWLLWRKGSKGGLTQNLLRETAREVGLVDYKICSVNPLWSAMLFTRKKA